MQRVPKGWGEELWVHNDPLYCGKILRLRKGKRCSLHFHKKKTETFYLQSGRVRMELRHPDGRSEDLVMKPGDSLEIYPGLVHRFSGIEDSEIVEFSTQHFEEDSYRIEKGD
ncbi:MAG TPA: cupin domain-containing protein [Planctomycetota bacterium]|nr:cupin domain-containing protein [Planctomycetota bacterium]